jgi:hypothetical protein
VTDLVGTALLEEELMLQSLFLMIFCCCISHYLINSWEVISGTVITTSCTEQDFLCVILRVMVENYCLVIGFTMSHTEP